MTNIVGVIKAQEKTVAQARGNNKRAEAQRAEAAVMYDVASAIAQAAREELHQHRAVLTQLQGARHTQRTGHEGPRNKGTQHPSLQEIVDDIQKVYDDKRLQDFVEVSKPNGWVPGGTVKFTRKALSNRSESFPSDDLIHVIDKCDIASWYENTVVYFTKDDPNPIKTGWNQAWLELA